MQSSQTLLIPTLEAILRAGRLVKTAVLVVSDYKMDAWGMASTENNQSSTPQQEHWQSERKRLTVALEKAQAEYADPEISNIEDLKQREEETRSRKKRMLEISEKLAESEEKLLESGSGRNLKHEKAATRLLELCRQNGGVYIKIGQHLANLDYVLPSEYISVLSSLFDDTPQTAYSDVCEVVREELNAGPDELFDNFNPQPIASASLAQVHVAYDKVTGRKLAIKVQHRGLRETSVGDIFAVQKVVHTCEQLFEDFQWGWIADEIAPQLPKELDFVNEAKNAESASKSLQSSGLDCVIPKVMWNLTSERVLAMEFEEGFKATDVDKIEREGLDRGDVARLIASVFSWQAFRAGHVHCDPHPANVLLRKNAKGKPQMVLVDHGLYRKLDDDFRLKYARLWKSLMLADLKGIKSHCQDLGVEKMYTLFAAMLTARPYDEIIERSKSGSLSATAKPGDKADQAIIRGYAQRFIHEIFELLSVVPRQMLLLLKVRERNSDL